MFKLSVRHGDIVREGWRNILELLIPLYRANLLPDEMTRVDDFVDPSGQIDIISRDKSGDKRGESQDSVLIFPIQNFTRKCKNRDRDQFFPPFILLFPAGPREVKKMRAILQNYPENMWPRSSHQRVLFPSLSFYD